MSANYSTVGDQADVRNMAAAAMFARLVLIPHDRMTPAQLADHRQPGGWCVVGCRGWWRVIAVRGGHPFAVWRCPTEASGLKLVKVLDRAMANGAYPIPERSAVTLGFLDALTDGSGRLRLPGRKSPRKAAATATGAA